MISAPARHPSLRAAAPLHKDVSAGSPLAGMADIVAAFESRDILPVRGWFPITPLTIPDSFQDGQNTPGRRCAGKDVRAL